MRQKLWPVRLVAALALLLTTVAVLRPAPAVADAAGLGGDFVPLTVNLLDTRNGTGGRTGVVGAAGVVAFPALGVGAIPASGVSAVLVRLVTTNATANSSLQVYPDGTTPNSYSNLHITTGEQLSNTAIVRPGANGKIAVRNSAGSAHIVITAQGYFTTTAGGGGGFVPVQQNVLADTRAPLNTTKGKIAANSTRTIKLAGVDARIPQGAKAILAEVVTLNATTSGWIGVAAGTTKSGISALNYWPTGNHSHLVSIPLSTTGEATFHNAGSGAVDLSVAPFGYVSAVAGEGSGYRHVPTTRVYDSGTALAAGAAVDVQVTGKLGMPTRGVAAVAVSVSAVAPSAAGLFVVYPTDGTMPNINTGYVRAGKTSAHMMIIRPGTDGKIRIKNNSPGTARFIVEFEGYFADPIPSAPIQTYTPVVGLQAPPTGSATASAVEYAFTNDLGTVRIGHQSDPDNFQSLTWLANSTLDAFSGAPTLAATSDSKVQLVAQNSDSDIWAQTQTAAGSSTWTSWADFGGSMAAPPALVRLPNNVMTAFAVDADGKLWVYQQTGTIPFWKPLTDQNFAGTPVAAATRTGVRLFIRNTSGALLTAEYVDGAVSGWTNLGGTGTTKPAAVVYPGYRTRVFAQQADGTVSTLYQNDDGTFPTAWTSLGTRILTGSPAAILDPVLFRTAVVARDPDGNVMVSWETNQGTGVFGAWTPAIPDAFELAYSDPTIVPMTNSAGQTWSILFQNNNHNVLVFQRAPITGMSGLTAFAAPSAHFTSHTLPAPPA